MLTRNRYQEEKEEEIRNCIEGLLSSIFENTERTIFVVSDDYYDDVVNKLYQVCIEAKKLNLLAAACQNYNVEYEFNDYLYNNDSQKSRRSMFIFKKIKKEKELVRTNSLYPKCPHK